MYEVIYFQKLSRMDIKVVGSENQIYQKQKLLGEGAFGKAYLVRRKADNQLLVIKEMNIDHMSKQQQKETIKQAQILKNLNHPNITRFVEVYITKQNKLKIVMEYAQCGDLSKSINDHKKTKKYYSESQILDWFTQICLAIKHCHDRKILHRDIKGQNIFITKSNTLKLGDFGIARVLNKTMEKARTVVGTPYYLSPEIIQNKPYSFKSDIWSIGVVLYELCALQHPFTATSLQFLALKIVKGSFSPIPSQYSKQLKSLVSIMLSLDPNKRPNINDIFKNPLIQDRIRNFLTQTKRDHQFSHTILHNHKVELLTNRLQELKQQKDFSKQRNKLKQQQEHLKHLLEKKRNQEMLAQEQREKQIIKQKERQKSLEKQKQKEQEKRRQFVEREKQRKQFEKKQRVFQDQKRKEQQQMKMQREYEQHNKMARYIQQKRKDQEQMDRLKQQYMEEMYKQSEKQEQQRAAEKMRKNRQKQLQEEKKKIDLQEFARKQFFQNQQIMRRAKERANQSERQDHYSYGQPATDKIDQKPKNQVYQPIPKKPSENFHYKNNSNQSNKNKTEQKKWTKPSQTKQQNADTKQAHSSVRQQIKKDRENYLRGHQNQKNVSDTNQYIQQAPRRPYTSGQKDTNGNKSQGKAVKGSKWQRPSSSRESKQSRKDSQQSAKKSRINQPTQQQSTIDHQIEEKLAEITSNDLVKATPKQQEQFDQYLLELQGILDNINKKVSEAEQKINNNDKNSPQKQKFNSENNRKDQVKFEIADNKEILPQIPLQDQEDIVILRQDDEDTLKLSLTADFTSQNNQQKSQGLPQVQQSCDLDYFSSFSKLQTLRMNLEDKFGTDNFVKIYRFLEEQIQQKGLEGFSDIYQITDDISVKFPQVSKNTLNQSFTLLLTLIHMEDKMMG